MTTHSKDRPDLLKIPKKRGLYDNTCMSEMWIEFDERRSTSLQGMRTQVAQAHDPVCSRALTSLPVHGRGGVVADVVPHFCLGRPIRCQHEHGEHRGDIRGMVRIPNGTAKQDKGFRSKG